MRVRQAMTRWVTTLRSDTPLEIAAQQLVSCRHASAPVVDGDGRIVGMVSEADLLRDQLPVDDRSEQEIDPEDVVAAVMTHQPVTAGPDEDLAGVVACMLDRGLRAIPVQTDGRCVGLLTRHDVLREVAHGTLQSEDRWRQQAEMASRQRG